MLIDAQLLPSNVTIEADVCIVGSGPAGITLARELAQAGLEICMLESGSEEMPDEATKSLGHVEIDESFLQVTSDNRNRKFGGNASYWGINLHQGRMGLRIVPLEETDFEQREWVPYSGWPFNRDHLVPYYQRAQQVFGAGVFDYTADFWASEDAPRLPFKGDRVTTRMFQFGYLDLFTRTYRDEIAQSQNITTYLHANAVELETNEDGTTVTHVRCACLNGKRFWVSARVVLLAAGAIENTHLLLLSNRANPNGLGNHHDVTGRFFMDHPLVAGGFIYPFNSAIFNQTALYDKRYVRGTNIMGSLVLTNEAVRRERLLNLVSWIFPRVKRLNSPAIASLKALVSPRGYKHGLSGLVGHLGNVVKNAGDVVDAVLDKVTNTPPPFFPTLATGGWSYCQPNREKVYGMFEVLHMTEQVPSPNNRLVLGGGIDRLGRQTIKLISSWSEADRNGIKQAQAILVEEIARAGIGKYVPARTSDGDPVVVTLGSSHHMGSTRMHDNPKHGVVDAHCRVHGVTNVFIASSSVFPTGGYANTTLTTVALAIRLADHIKSRLSSRVELSTPLF